MFPHIRVHLSFVRLALLAAAVLMLLVSAFAVAQGNGPRFSPVQAAATDKYPSPSPSACPSDSGKNVCPSPSPSQTPVAKLSTVFSIGPTFCNAQAGEVGAQINVGNPVAGRTFRVTISGGSTAIVSSTITLSSASGYLAAASVPMSLQDSSAVTAFVVAVSNPSAGVLLLVHSATIPSCFPAKTPPTPAPPAPTPVPPVAKPPTAAPVSVVTKKQVPVPVTGPASAPSTGGGGCSDGSCG